jgi:hypothetical protein
LSRKSITSPQPLSQGRGAKTQYIKNISPSKGKMSRKIISQLSPSSLKERYLGGGKKVEDKSLSVRGG